MSKINYSIPVHPVSISTHQICISCPIIHLYRGTHQLSVDSIIMTIMILMVLSYSCMMYVEMWINLFWISAVAQMAKKRKICLQNLQLIPGSGRSPEEGNGNSLQCSCLENSMDRRVWWATVHGVTKSWTWTSTNYSTYLLTSLLCHYT